MQELPYIEMKLLQTDVIIGYSVIMVISNKYPIQLLYQFVRWAVAVCPYIVPHLFIFLSEFLPARFPLYSGLSVFHPSFQAPIDPLCFPFVLEAHYKVEVQSRVSGFVFRGRYGADGNTTCFP